MRASEVVNSRLIPGKPSIIIASTLKMIRIDIPASVSSYHSGFTLTQDENKIRFSRVVDFLASALNWKIFLAVLCAFIVNCI